MNILDYYCHQGHQYEFSKINHNIYLIGLDGRAPIWNKEHRPLRDNVHLISESDTRRLSIDLVMVRSPSVTRVRKFLERGIPGIAVVQTTEPYYIPRQIEHIVWNSSAVMSAKKNFYGNKHHHYIVHGFNPNEFLNTKAERNKDVLTVANHFKLRGGIMGYDTWSKVYNNIKNCYVVGSKNEGIPNNLGEAKNFSELINLYNSYGVFLNTTRNSAMPRSRAEAAMCGMPIVTINNYEIGSYFVNNKSAFLVRDHIEATNCIKKLLKSEQMREDFGMAARDVAIRNFHINDYIDKWQYLLDKVV